MLSGRAKVIAGMGVVAATLLPSAALAQEYGGGSSVPDTVATQQVSDPGESSTLAASASGSLPLTGGDVVGLSAIALGAIGGGLALARGGRKRATA